MSCADVRDRGRGEDAAHRVAGLGLDRLLVDEVGVGGVLGKPLARPVLHLRYERAVGVEDAVEVADVPHSQSGLAHLRRAEVAIAAEHARVVFDVARRLLEVRHQTSPLEDLGEQVRRLLAREVHAAELGNGVVAVLEEHTRVELFGTLQADGRVDREIAREVEIADELVEKEAAQALVGA
jgi:hypothetical protein